MTGDQGSYQSRKSQHHRDGGCAVQQPPRWTGGQDAGGRDDDRLYGEDGHDRLHGESGNDYISGANGNDSIDGGRGNDFMFGGNGRDIFQFTADSDDYFGRDTVRDFTANVDRMDLRDLGLTYDQVMAQATQVGENVVLNFRSTGHITMLNVDLAALDQADFIL